MHVSFFNYRYILCALFRKLDDQEPHIYHPHFDPGECYSTGILYKFKLSQKNLASVTVTRPPNGQMLNRWLSEKSNLSVIWLRFRGAKRVVLYIKVNISCPT